VVNGFLDKWVYTEGAVVKAGDVMFQQDTKPFQAQLDVALGGLAEQQARLQVANDNLAQVKPLAALNALPMSTQHSPRWPLHPGFFAVSEEGRKHHPPPYKQLMKQQN
jgi:hypothetical protein